MSGFGSQGEDELDRIFCTRIARSMTEPGRALRAEVVRITPTDVTRRLAGRRRAVEVHQCADGRLEIHCEGKSLPYSVVEERPDVAPGEVVERKRVAEIVSLIGEQQRRGWRQRPGQSWLRDKPALPTPKPQPRPVQQVVVKVVTRGEDVESATGKRFVVRWVRRKAFLYERAVKGEAVGTGRPILEDKLLGQVDATVAQEWQARGDASVPPQLQAEEPAPPEPADRLPSPAPAVDTSQRLSAALWFTDTFHAAETERLRAAVAAADEAFAAQFRDEPARATERTPKSSPRSGRTSHVRGGAAAAAIPRSATSARR
jgi:hypothetical protein